MKTGQWIKYEGENWNVYKILDNERIILHPEKDNGISNGAIMEVSLDEIKLQEEL